MKKSTSGFTIVELLVIIIVIGILAGITIVAYNNVQTNALNAARISELKDWHKSFAQYKAANGRYPDMPNGGYCLGTGFPDGKCRNYTASSNVYYESDSTALMEALASYDPPQAGTRVPVQNITIGPYVDYTNTQVSLKAALPGSGAGDCPDGTSFSWGDGSRIVCQIILSK